MKKLGFTIFTAAVLALPICAQPPAAVANVTFGFVAGNATMPAGNYVVGISASSSAVALLGAGQHSQLLNSIRGDARSSPGQSVLVFHSYGDRYFLAEIRTPDEGRVIPTSRLEREARETASGGRASQEIIVAMR